jgi:hypothetical protein
VVATDGLWDYYTPESTVLTETRRKLRQCNNDPQQTADWLVSGPAAAWAAGAELRCARHWMLAVRVAV